MNRQTKTILVVGSSNTDMVVRVPGIPKPGETVIGRGFTMSAGGKGANQAVAAARAGGRAVLIARVGNDLFGDQAVAGFKAEGLDTRFVFGTEGAASGIALIQVDDRGENSIAVAPGANSRLSTEDLEGADEAFAGADIVLLQLETPIETVAAAARKAGERGVPVLLNPAPARELDDALLQYVAFLTPNGPEAEFLSGAPVRNEGEAMRAAGRLRGRGAARVIITLGEVGVYASAEEFEGLMPAFQVDPVDTTAAGDVFCGTLGLAIAEQRPLADALHFAQAAAALSVTRIGAQRSAPSRSEIEDFLASRT